MVLAECPHVDVNWQDSEGNTALITAAQAGKTQLSLPSQSRGWGAAARRWGSGWEGALHADSAREMIVKTGIHQKSRNR